MAQYAASGIDAQLPMQVQVQQLVHHVCANADNLTSGIATCRSIGQLLPAASSSTDASRVHLMAAVREADSSLRIAELHQRKQNLLALQALCAAVGDARALEERATCALPILPHVCEPAQSRNRATVGTAVFGNGICRTATVAHESGTCCMQHCQAGA
jgi:hypothetical protein